MTHPELYILRHGETVWNAENRMQGWLDSPLTSVGEEQARRQRDILAARELDGFQRICSPLGRARQTAEIVFGENLADLKLDERLREIGVGDWAGLRRDDLPVGDGPDAFLVQYDEAPGGEGLEGLRKRCKAFLADLSGPAVLVTHGITSRTLRSILIGTQALHPAGVGGGQGVVYQLKNGARTLLR